VHARLSTDTIGVVKEHVSAVLGVSAEQLELSHEDTGRGDPRILRSETATQDLDVLMLTFSGDVAPPARVVSVELPPSLRAAHRSPLPIAMREVDTIGSLKAPLAKALGVKAARLTLHGQDGNVLSDDATLPQAGHMQQLRLSLPGYSEGADRLIDKCLEAHAEDPDAPCTALRQQHDISAGFACIEEHGCDPITRCTGTDEPSARVLMQHTHAALDQDLNGEDIYLLQRQIDAIQTKLSQKKRELESAPPRIPPTPPTQATASRRSDALQPEASPVAMDLAGEGVGFDGQAMESAELIVWALGSNLFTSDIDMPVILITSESESSVEAQTARYLVEPRCVRDDKPVLFLVNATPDGNGLHWGGLVAGDGKGIRSFEPARGGTQETNRALIGQLRVTLQTCEQRGSQPFGPIGSCPTANLCPPQRGMEQGGTACGRALKAGLLMHLHPEYVRYIAQLMDGGYRRDAIVEAWVAKRFELDPANLAQEMRDAQERLEADAPPAASFVAVVGQNGDQRPAATAAEAQREEKRQRAAAKDEQGAFTLDKFEKLVLSSIEWMTPSQCFDDTVFELIESLPKGDARAVAFRAMCDQHLVDWNILIEMYDLGAKTNALFHYEYAQLLVEQMLWIAAQKLQWEHCTDAELVQNVQNQSSANFVDEWASQYDWLEQLHSSAKQLHSSATDSHLAKRPRPNPPEDEPASGLMG